ncbi:unnamed protein product [Caenorhabditis auriculariae]|uniref:Uncharacterized protein n=1 Tax=Caenorhabditis auriculariae TaxID=2777116 RepID=A0A8S1HF38_9PELO|nr:unnamed protein product [Caenorhabditis auriculariae]
MILVVAVVLILSANAATTSFNKPNIYSWLQLNSYICDPSLSGQASFRFLTPTEAIRLRCACGDVSVTRTACGRRSFEKPSCFALPAICMQEYSVIFANAANRIGSKGPSAARRPSRTFTQPRTRQKTAFRFTKKRATRRRPIQRSRTKHF